MLPETESYDTETPEQNERLQKAVNKWLQRIEKEKDIHEDYRDSASLAWDVYLDEADAGQQCYPLLWSIVQIEHSAVYSQVPIPDVRPRNTERNPLYRETANVMQRALEYAIDQSDFHENYDRVVDDYLVAGLGVPRIKLDADIVEVDTGAIDMETGEPEMEEVIADQMVRLEYVPSDRFGWEPCSNWEHCEWIYFEHKLTKKEVKRRWGDVQIDTSANTQGLNRSTSRGKRQRKENRVTIYEIWDKRNREVIVIAKGVSEPLEVADDPLGLSNFFPCPKPLFLNLPPDDLTPTTDYTYIEPTALELNRLYKRARCITEQLKATSLHDASMIEIEDWKTISDGDSIPVEHLMDRVEGGADLRKVIMFWPLEERMQTLEAITQQIAQKRAHVDDIMGISDIVRGTSNPQDGVGTNQIKERWAGIRMKRKQNSVQLQLRQVFRLMAEVTVEHVTPENLTAMTQIDITPEMMQLLRNDTMREYAIDVETDSTIARDEFQERAERTELLNAISNYVQQVAPAVNGGQIGADLGREILQIATDPYKKYSKGMNDVIEQMPTNQAQLQKMNQQIQQGQQQVQQKDQEIQQLKYALDQYSQAEEKRQNQESAAKVAKDQATAQKTQAGVQDETVQPGKTVAETDKIRAETMNIATQPQIPII